MLPQLAPLPSQRCHWYVNVIGFVPDHSPSLATTSSPSCAVPTTAGDSVFAGTTFGSGAARPTSVAMAVSADAAPAARTSCTFLISGFPPLHRLPMFLAV